MRIRLNNVDLVNKARLPLDFKVQLIEILLQHGDRRSRVTYCEGAHMPLGIGTQHSRTTSLLAGFVQLRDDGFELKSPRDLELAHLHHLVQRWVQKGLTASTVENKLSHWRTFAEWIDKAQLVGTLADYVDRASGYRRLYGGSTRKSTERSAVSRLDVLNALRATNGNKQAAARALGISRQALYRLLPKFGMTSELL